MRLPLYQIDAFTSTLFKGNPAAVVPLTEWLPDAVLRSIAAENNLAETAFYLPRPGGKEAGYDIRWFTPATEVDLCGHATLATAYVIMRYDDPAADAVTFHTRDAGVLTVRQTGPDGDLLELDFPTRPPTRLDNPALLATVSACLNAPVVELWQARDLLVVLDSPETLRALTPNYPLIATLPTFALIATAPGAGLSGSIDFVSRFFAPQQGIPEDPVTGSAHCTLTPYWTHRLNKPNLHALQLSPRGGELFCGLAPADPTRTLIAGRAVRYLEGSIYL